MNTFSSPPVWQCVAICWGTKFAPHHLTDLFDQVRRTASVPAQFVLLTDHVRPDMPDDVIQRVIDPFYVQPQFMATGAQTKLAQFATGALPFDVPTVFLDLDTLVVGDVYRVVQALADSDQILMLANSPLVFSRAARAVTWLSRGRLRSRGNSSAMCYLPSRNHHIDTIFRTRIVGESDVPRRAMAADDKFISWIEHDRLRAIPTRIAVKFPLEYMRRFRWQVIFRAHLPWVRARRAGLAVVTFPGQAADIEVLRDLPDASTLEDGKKRVLVWDDVCAFPVKQILAAKSSVRR